LCGDCEKLLFAVRTKKIYTATGKPFTSTNLSHDKIYVANKDRSQRAILSELPNIAHNGNSLGVSN
jgi:hypothetical protein